jgi:hypothetical protein
MFTLMIFFWKKKQKLLFFKKKKTRPAGERPAPAALPPWVKADVIYGCE